MPLVNVKVDGGKELIKRLDSLRGIGASEIARKALLAGTTPIYQDAKFSVPIKTGKLGLTVRVDFEKSQSRKDYGTALVKAGSEKVKRGTGGGAGEVIYAPFVEFGHRVGRRARNVDIGVRKGKRLSVYQRNYKRWLDAQRKKVEPRPFLGPAFEANVKESLEIITMELDRLITIKATGGTI